MNRRQFIRAGVVGGSVLAAGGAWVAWHDRRGSNRMTTAAANARQRRIDRIVGAIAPVILGGALPVDATARAAALRRVPADVGRVIANFTPPVQDEVHQLFSLLAIGVARRVLAGLAEDWPDADPREVAAFLDRWRDSSFASMQSGYLALHDLVLGAWYASPATWASIGYEGPPALG